MWNNSYACGNIYAENGMLTSGYGRENQCEKCMTFLYKCSQTVYEFVYSTHSGIVYKPSM